MTTLHRFAVLDPFCLSEWALGARLQRIPFVSRSARSTADHEEQICHLGRETKVCEDLARRFVPGACVMFVGETYVPQAPTIPSSGLPCRLTVLKDFVAADLSHGRASERRAAAMLGV